MQEENAEQTDETTASGDEGQVADAIDDQAQQSSGADAEKAPEVPDDARETIARAEDHLRNVDMGSQRAAAERTSKNL